MSVFTGLNGNHRQLGKGRLWRASHRGVTNGQRGDKSGIFPESGRHCQFGVKFTGL
jgi:hypothetical protein